MKERIIEKRSGIQVVRSAVARIPEASDIENLKVGGRAPDCFGRLAVVTRIVAIGTTHVDEIPFVHYVTAMNEFDPGSGTGCSASMVEGRLIRTVDLAAILNSHECDMLEQEMNILDPLIEAVQENEGAEYPPRTPEPPIEDLPPTFINPATCDHRYDISNPHYCIRCGTYPKGRW